MSWLAFLKTYVLDLLRRAFAREGWLVKLWPLWSLFLVCFVVVLFLNPVKAGLVLYGIGKVLLGGLVGLMLHWGMRRMYPLPPNASGIEVGTDWKCCSWIICAAVIALALLP